MCRSTERDTGRILMWESNSLTLSLALSPSPSLALFLFSRGTNNKQVLPRVSQMVACSWPLNVWVSVEQGSERCISREGAGGGGRQGRCLWLIPSHWSAALCVCLIVCRRCYGYGDGTLSLSEQNICVPTPGNVALSLTSTHSNQQLINGFSLLCLPLVFL